MWFRSFYSVVAHVNNIEATIFTIIWVNLFLHYIYNSEVEIKGSLDGFVSRVRGVLYFFFDNAMGDKQLRRDRFLISEKMVQFRYILEKVEI
jgi:hypothetical protein